MPVRLAANISLLFTEIPYLDRPSAAAAAGFAAIETWWPFGVNPYPSAAEVGRLLEAVARADVQLVAVNFFAGDMPSGERGVVSLPDRIEDFRRSTEVMLRIGAETGCERFNALYGVRDERFGVAEQDATAIGNLRYAAEVVGQAGGTVLVEALARGENGAYPLSSPDDVIRVVEECGLPNVAMLADFYHLTRNGYDFTPVLDRYLPKIAHMQVADVPGRHEPGTGDINFPALFRAIQASGYIGWVGAEYRPLGDTASGLRWAADLGLFLHEG